MITITLNFTSIDAAVRALREIPENSLVLGAPAAPKAAPATEAAASGQATAKAGAAQQKTAAEKTPTAPSAEAAPSASTAATGEKGNVPAAEPSAPAATAASTASSSEPAPSVDYKTLQQAVFALAGKSREAAAAVAQSFGVKTFKELDPAKWADALAAVQAKTAEL